MVLDPGAREKAHCVSHGKLGPQVKTRNGGGGSPLGVLRIPQELPED